MTTLRHTFILAAVLMLVATRTEAQQIKFESAYQTDPISFAIIGETSRDVRYINISGKLGGKGKLILDANVCSLDQFGERDLCTQVYYRPFDVDLPKLADQGVWTLYGIVPQGAVFPQYTLRIAVNSEEPATANLLLNSGFAPDVILRVITLRHTHKPFSPVGKKLAGKTHTVKMQDFKFVPNVLTVKVGDSVAWVNEGSVAHNAQRDDAPSFQTKLVGSGEKTKPVLFSEKGRFQYFCQPHKSFMKAFIVVE